MLILEELSHGETLFIADHNAKAPMEINFHIRVHFYSPLRRKHLGQTQRK